MKKKIAEKSIGTGAVFYGVCHAGVGDTSFPSNAGVIWWE